MGEVGKEVRQEVGVCGKGGEKGGGGGNGEGVGEGGGEAGRSRGRTGGRTMRTLTFEVVFLP